jgi:hypothetical protein
MTSPKIILSEEDIYGAYDRDEDVVDDTDYEDIGDCNR